jgi:cobalt-zinc-cadmium efflux system outer membrane protein
MSYSLLRAAVLAAVLLPAGAAGAAPLTLDQAVELAARRAPMARAARAGATGAAEMARAAGQLPDPMLSLGLDNVPATGRDRFSTGAEEMTMKRIGIAQEWVPAEKRAAREAAAQAMAGREAAMEQVAAAEARMQAAMAYVDAYFAVRALVLTTLNEHHAREALATGRGRLATVSGNPAEVLALASALAVAEDESAELRQQQAASAVALQRWTGLAADELAEPRLADLPPPDRFVESHPSVVARQRDIDVARQDVQVARLDRRPNWTYEVSYGQRLGRPDLVSLGVNIPLPLAPEERQDRETAARQALVDRAEAELEEARRGAAAEHATLAGEAQRLQERIVRFEAGVLVPPASARSCTGTTR